MKTMYFVAAAILALSMHGVPAWAGTADEHILLTPALLQKLKNANMELSKLDLPDDKEDEKYRQNGKLPVEYFIRSTESKSAVKALLAKHGLTPKEFRLSTYALLHGAMYLSTEATMDKRSVAQTMAKFTKEQRENIALLRKLGQSAYSLN